MTTQHDLPTGGDTDIIVRILLMIHDDLHSLALRPAAGAEPAADRQKLLFNFDQVTRKDIYMVVIDLLRRKAFSSTQKNIIGFLAAHTNLGSEDAVRTQLYEYKKCLL